MAEKSWLDAVLAAFYEGLGETQREVVESVSMDMRAPYIAATLAARG